MTLPPSSRLDGRYNPIRSAYIFMKAYSPMHTKLDQLKAKPAFMGQLSVGVMEAKGLPKMDFFGHTDAYAWLGVEGTHEQTAVVDNAADPQWNEEFTFKVQSRKEPIRCVVFDQDNADSDDPIGQVSITLVKSN